MPCDGLVLLLVVALGLLRCVPAVKREGLRRRGGCRRWSRAGGRGRRHGRRSCRWRRRPSRELSCRRLCRGCSKWTSDTQHLAGRSKRWEFGQSAIGILESVAQDWVWDPMACRGWRCCRRSCGVVRWCSGGRRTRGWRNCGKQCSGCAGWH